MSPEQIAAITSLIGIMSKVASWPFGMVVFAMVVGPWVLALILAQQYRHGLEEIRQMYKNNVHLVEGYQSVCRDLRDVIIMNTQSNTELTGAVRTNQFCPMVRLKKQSEGIVD